MLLKGVNKRVIVIKNPESEIFEEAYFIVKNKSIFNQARENEMVLEANRIISDYSRQQKISAGENKGKNEKKTPGFSDEELFDEIDFFEKGGAGDADKLSKLVYPVHSSGFGFISSKKIRKLRLPSLKVPPKSFFIGVGFMSAIIIAARVLEFILSR